MPTQPTVIATTLDVLVPLIQQWVQSIVGPAPPAGFPTLAVPLSPAQVILTCLPETELPQTLMPQGGVMLKMGDYGEMRGEKGGGRYNMEMKRELIATCWTRMLLDQTDHAESFLTNVGTPLNHFALEHAVLNALHGTHITDQHNNLLTANTIRWMSGRRPTKPTNMDGWGWTPFWFELHWIEAITASYQ